MAAYFAFDGNYGDAHALVIMDTDHWDEMDWRQIDKASDDARIMVALEIAQRYA